jgi:hypothetical protein
MGGPLFALIFAGLIILILLIVGQLFYNKFPRVSLTIWGLTVLLLAYFIYSFNTANSSFGDKVKNEFVGTFKIDIYQSNFDSTDLKNYSDLLLNVKGTFLQRHNRLLATYGRWRYFVDRNICWR